jgi:ribosomal protein S18 acetylase RimI-like enzyme
MKDNMINLRPLRREDASFLCSIFKDNADYYQIFFDPANTLKEWECRVSRFLVQTDMYHCIIESDRAPVGWLSYYDAENSERELCVLVLHPDHLCKGYGAQSLAQLIEKSKAQGMDCLLLNVNQANARAIRFYERFGFKIIGEEIVPECNDAINLAQYQMRLTLA